ncbi:MAG: hypothetical protein O9311_18915 [Cytophagales bacterium]|nr:hypothetical protein [Cytophagales bacterium]
MRIFKAFAILVAVCIASLRAQAQCTAFTVSGGGTICAGATGPTINLSGSQSGVSYQLKVGTTNVGAARSGTGAALSWTNNTTAGTYTVVATKSTAPTCTLTMTGSATVAVNPLPTLFTVAGGGTICSGATGPTITLSGSQTGVNYQLRRGSTNVGTSVAGTGSALSWANNSTAGSYTVVATNATTTCAATMTGSATVTVNALPSAFTVSGTATICQGASATITLSGSQTGVNYQLRLNGVNTGTARAGTGSSLSWAGQTTAGPYTVVATNATTNCTSNMTGTATLTVNPLPTLFSMTGTANLCGSGTLNLGLSGSQSGTSYQLRRDATNVGTAVSGTGSTISFPAQTAQGSYTVLATRSGCTLLMTGSARIGALPVAPTVVGTSRCGTGSVSVTANSSAAGTFTWYSLSSGGGILQTSAPGVTTNTYTITSLASTTTYYVTFKDANGCESSPRTAVTATVNAPPAILSVSGGGASCSAGLTWTASYVITTPTSVKNTIGGLGPLAISNETLPVGVDGWVEFTSLENGNNSDKIVGFKAVSSPAGYTTDYGLRLSQSAVFVDENGVTRNLTNPYFTPGDLFRVERIGTAIRYLINGTLVYTSTVPSATALQVYVALNNAPSIDGIQTSFAPVASKTVNLSSSVTGINYQLKLNGSSDVGAPLAGTGAALQWTVTVPGSYTVVGTNGATSCSSTMSGTASVTAATTPRSYLLTGGVNLPATFTLSGSQTGVNYQLRMNGANVGTAIAGTGNALTWNVTNVGSYDVVALNTLSACNAVMVGTIATEIGLVPDALEYQALKDLFLSTNGANWANKTNWPTTWPATATAAQMGTWFGITVSNGDVIAIDLIANNLNGPLPSAIGNLLELQSLGFRANALTGEMPAAWASLTKLTSLNLAYTLISGSLPGYLNSLTNLTSLQVVAGNVTGPFPDLSNLSSLQVLFLEANFTPGPIPQYMSTLTSLTHLMISNTNRTGLIPPALGNLPLLQTLQMNNNQLSGPIPNTLGSHSSLWSINLSYNQLSGTLPPELGKPSIGSLQLSNNSLTGTVPESFKQLTGINNLYLRSNQLVGELPANLFQSMPYLTNLDLSNNKFTGDFPAVAGCTGLSMFSIFNNRFTTLHPSITSRPNLYWLEISSNDFRTLPDLTQHINKVNLQLMVDDNFLDFTILEPLAQAGFGRYYGPNQKAVDDVTSAVITNELRIRARPKTANTAITWLKKQANGTWSDVTSNNQDATGQTYLRTAATLADEGFYQWRATSTQYPWPMVLQSTEIEARQGPSATDSQVLYNGLITTARWRTDKAEGAVGDGFKGMYHYTYDEKYQIQEANFSEPVFALNGYQPQGNRYRLTNMSYDPNGNIQTLRRFNGNGQVQHDFAYTYKPRTNQLQSINGYSNYTYNAIGQMTVADKTEANADQYVDYDVTGKVVAVFKDAGRSQLVTRYAYDDRGFRMAKITYPNGSGEATTTWYIRDASGNILSIYQQKGIGIAQGSEVASTQAAVQKEVPVYGSGKLGTYYPAHSQLADQAGHEAGSTDYEVTDHLGNVRALLRTHVNEYTATLEDDGTATYTNPRVRENVYFKNLWATEKRDPQMNHTSSATMPNSYLPERSAYLRWVNGQAGNGPQQKSVGPAIALAVKAGDRINASAWARFKVKASYSRAPLQNIIASVLSGQYAYSNGLESITQATNSFAAGLAGLAPNGGDNPNAPSAYLNYILFDNSYARVAAGAVQVPQAAGFEEPQRSSGYTNNNLLKFENAIDVSQPGYLYVWVSNESEDTEVWFDDLNVVHQTTIVSQATDYETWGGVLREQKWGDMEGGYRWAYQGKYAEKDEETGWEHFELREYDDIRGQWTSMDPKGQFYSPYIGMGNNPVNGTDPDGGECKGCPKTKDFQQYHDAKQQFTFMDGIVVNGDGSGPVVTPNSFSAALIRNGSFFKESFMSSHYYSNTKWNKEFRQFAGAGVNIVSGLMVAAAAAPAAAEVLTVGQLAATETQLMSLEASSYLYTTSEMYATLAARRIAYGGFTVLLGLSKPGSFGMKAAVECHWFYKTGNVNTLPLIEYGASYGFRKLLNGPSRFDGYYNPPKPKLDYKFKPSF